MRGGDCADAGDGDYEATVFFDADYGAFRSFKVAGDDADSLPGVELLEVLKVFEVLVFGVCDEAKHVHFVV